ncbi:MAG: hypothetical protein JKX71_08710 [Amylibacter sp.]|nr:hypothetical protein [Amylibacter sp.]
MSGYFETPDGVLPIKMPIFFMIPPILFVLALTISRNVAAWADRIDITTLTSLQSWRVMGFTFLILWALGELPLVFALLSGFGDVATGVYAAFATVKVSQRKAGWQVSARRVIYLGSVDFAVAVVTGLLSAAGYLKLYPSEVSAHLMTAYPMVMFPIFIVPTFIILHILAWRNIAKA